MPAGGADKLSLADTPTAQAVYAVPVEDSHATISANGVKRASLPAALQRVFCDLDTSPQPVKTGVPSLLALGAGLTLRAGDVLHRPPYPLVRLGPAGRVRAARRAGVQPPVVRQARRANEGGRASPRRPWRCICLTAPSPPQGTPVEDRIKHLFCGEQQMFIQCIDLPEVRSTRIEQARCTDMRAPRVSALASCPCVRSSTICR